MDEEKAAIISIQNTVNDINNTTLALVQNQEHMQYDISDLQAQQSCIEENMQQNKKALQEALREVSYEVRALRNKIQYEHMHSEFLEIEIQKILNNQQKIMKTQNKMLSKLNCDVN